MPVYHFIYHGYRTWNADHPEGYFQHGEWGRRRMQVRLGAYRNEIARQEMMVFDEGQMRAMLAFVREICGRREWRVHGAGMDETHVHVVVSWRDGTEWREVRDRVKNLVSLLLNRSEDRVGRLVFSKKSGRRRVWTMKHLGWLREEYLPRHAWWWWEGAEGLVRGKGKGEG